ncbi:hypothetical protein FN846DRAFT_913220 [Sphaerosporella brunnea]|uniref:Uncharacterized protein n=1 Tax=Sphaerosporella brunnea TaxID=1250544 RepID=A0A5J5EGD6_9PEZI|nr:hypothetical protein FN846DRAFT_913220 [Sphaerosporella brunnea]
MRGQKEKAWLTSPHIHVEALQKPKQRERRPLARTIKYTFGDRATALLPGFYGIATVLSGSITGSFLFAQNYMYRNGIKSMALVAKEIELLKAKTRMARLETKVEKVV